MAAGIAWSTVGFFESCKPSTCSGGGCDGRKGGQTGWCVPFRILGYRLRYRLSWPLNSRDGRYRPATRACSEARVECACG
jgi:hypothetical protein